MAEQHKEATNTAAASDGLPAAVAPRKKGNVRFAFAFAILASMTSILLGYGMYIFFFLSPPANTSYYFMFFYYLYIDSLLLVEELRVHDVLLASDDHHFMLIVSNIFLRASN